MLERLAILHSRMSGYSAACQRVLQERFGVELLCFHSPVAPEAPFDARVFGHLEHSMDRTNRSADEIVQIVTDFGAQAILMSGWFSKAYLAAAREARKSGIPVIAGSDAQWTGSVRQHAGRLMSQWMLKPSIDVLWVAGERQRMLANRFGFTGSRCWSGVYACDWQKFGSAYDPAESASAQSYLLFVGRYVPVKGLDVLLDAYEEYRKRVERPWPLVCAGTGELASLLEHRDGVTDRGFVQPDELPTLMRNAAGFVLPSRREPWGVVLQEAAATGLPLICSEACGAAVHLLQDGYNGFLFESGNAQHLERCLLELHASTNEDRTLMGNRSHELSKQFTPERWARTLIDGVRMLNQTK